MLKHILISKLFGIDLLDVALGQYKLTRTEQKELEQKLELLGSGFPLDYIIGKVKILGLELIVNEHTLIPREETEFWLQQSKDKIQNSRHLEQSYRSHASIKNNSKVLIDLGTGTGIIGLYLSDVYQKVYLLDINDNTLEATRQNILLNRKTNCQAILSNGLKQIKNLIDYNQKWDLVANLPYLPIGDIAKAKDYKVEHEPTIALYSGQDGLKLFDKVLEQIKTMQNKPSNVLFELDPRNIQRAKTSLERLNYQTEIWLDQNGLERVLVGALC